MTPKTRKETYLAKAAGDDVSVPSPITREEVYLNALATGEAEGLPDPVTREEVFLKAAAEGGGGSSVTVEPLSVTENGTYTAPSGKAYSPVTVGVESLLDDYISLVNRSITVIPNSALRVTTVIGPYAFCSCLGIESVVIPQNVVSVLSRAFMSCSSLRAVRFDNPNTHYEYSYGIFENTSALVDVTLPANATIIPSEIFKNSNLQNGIDLPSGITEIGSSAFFACKFSSITIPSAVTKIGDQAFGYNSNLTEATVLSTTPPTITTGYGKIFLGCSNLSTIYVPSASVSAYQADAGWSNYASLIQAIPNS